MQDNNYIQLKTEIQQSITPEQAWHYSIIPKSVNNSSCEFYVDEEKEDDSLPEELEMLFGKKIKLIKIQSDLIRKTLSRYYRKNKQKTSKSISIARQDDEFLNKLINEAHQNGSSDIHMEPYEEKCRVRMRIDGKLIERYVISLSEYPAIVNKIKIKANLDIAEKRLPQDGRIFFDSQEENFDIRVSILPTLHGEKVVLRLLSKDATQIEITELGMNEKQLHNYTEGIKKPHGIVLISGPTGSGKTTTLYATLKILNNEYSNLLTIEDPIEYTLEGINQVQLKENIGLSFAKALRTFLRQDPDIIMLGEIRDQETAKMATRAALTGHLVLSTIHTNSAWGTISRMIDMGIPPYLLASTLNLSVAQRLVRLLCPHCKKQRAFNEKLYPDNYVAPREIETEFIPVGCEKCFYTGYKGRKAVYEIIPVDVELQERIKENDLEVSEYFKKKSIQKLEDAAFDLFEKGFTSIDEVYSIFMNS